MMCVSHLKGQLYLIGDFVARLLANGPKAARHPFWAPEFDNQQQPGDIMCSAMYKNNAIL